MPLEGNPSTGICIEDLYPFSEHCPALGYVMLPVAPIPPAAPAFCAGEGSDVPVRHNLRYLDVGHSHLQGKACEECKRIAQFLSAVFPVVRFKTWEILQYDGHGD